MASQPTRTPSTDELDYQRRLDENFAPETRSTTGEPTEVYAPFAVEGNDTSGFVGVSPEYMTYADDTSKPMRAESGVEAAREARVFDAAPVVAAPATTSLDADTGTQGAGNSSDLVYTAYSGEGFTAQKAVAVPLEVKREEATTAEPETVTVTEPKTEKPSAETVTPSPAAAPPAEDIKVEGAKAKSGQGVPVPPPAS